MSVNRHWIVRGTTVNDLTQYSSIAAAEAQARIYAAAHPTENYVIYAAVSYAYVDPSPVVVQPVIAA